MEKPILKQTVTLKIKRGSLAYQLLEGLRGKETPCFWYRGENGYIFSFIPDEYALYLIDFWCANGEAEVISQQAERI